MIDHRGALYLSFMYISAAVQVHDNDNGHARPDPGSSLDHAT